MINNREACIKETLKWEGGYSNHPSDPGGATNWGITIIDARKYWKANATPADVKAMPLSVAIDIYTKRYWRTPYYDCDKLNAGVDLAVYDFGVNSGPARAKKYLDKAVGGTDQETIKKLCSSRLAFLQGLKTWPVFGKGWGNRVKGIQAKALVMANAPQVVTVPKQSTAKKSGFMAAILAALAGVAAFVQDHPVETTFGAITVFAILWLLWSRKGNTNV